MSEDDVTSGTDDTSGNINEQPASAQHEDEKPVLTKAQKFKKEPKSLSLILLGVLIFRSSFFEPFRIPSGSMIPTLMVGDFILVNKTSYGFKLPFSDVWTDPLYLFGKDDPDRGDVVVFKWPKDPSVNYIKRVIGLPGDTLEIRNKVVYVNDEAIQAEEITNTPEGEAVLEDMDDKFKAYNLRLYEAVVGEHKHLLQQDGDNFYKVDYRKTTIPEGMFFVMGDNRDFSYDSRFWGFVPHEAIKGKALFVWFSMILPFSEHNFKFRPWRIGTAID